MAAIRGLDCKLYRNTNTYASPTWVEIENVKDLSVPNEKTMADASTRRSGVAEEVGTIKKLGIEFDMVKDHADADWEALNDAYWGNTVVEFLCLDGSKDVAGSRGVRFGAEVAKFDETQSLEGVVMNAVKLSPSRRAENAPAEYEVP